MTVYRQIRKDHHASPSGVSADTSLYHDLPSSFSACPSQFCIFKPCHLLLQYPTSCNSSNDSHESLLSDLMRWLGWNSKIPPLCACEEVRGEFIWPDWTSFMCICQQNVLHQNRQGYQDGVGNGWRQVQPCIEWGVT